MNKKKLLFIIPLVCLLGFIINQSNLFYNPSKEAERLNTAFIKCLNAKDTKGIKSLMCDYTLHIEGLDEQIENMFEFFDEEALPIKISDVQNISEHAEISSIRDGVRTAQVNAGMTINTKNGKEYKVILYNYAINPDKKKEGVSKITVSDKTGLEMLEERLNNPNKCEVGKLIK